MPERKKRLYLHIYGAERITAGIIIFIIGLAVGSIIYLLYKPFETMNTTKMIFIASCVVMVLGLGMCAAGSLALSRKAEWERLRSEGIRYYADIIDCLKSDDYIKNIRENINPDNEIYNNEYTLICKYTDRNGVVRECKSPSLSYDPRNFISGKITVYVDTANPKKYFMDIMGSMNIKN